MPLLCRASPPLAEIRFIFLFQRLWSMPLKGNLTATMLEMVTLYTPWVHAMAEEAPGEAAEILEDFSCFLNTGELGFVQCCVHGTCMGLAL